MNEKQETSALSAILNGNLNSKSNYKLHFDLIAIVILINHKKLMLLNNLFTELAII